MFNDIYQLESGGEDVAVTTDLHYGLVPGVLTDHVAYSAKITDGGYRSRYERLQLLGAIWVATCDVAPDTIPLSGTHTCAWGEGREQLFCRSGRGERLGEALRGRFVPILSAAQAALTLDL